MYDLFCRNKFPETCVLIEGQVFRRCLSASEPHYPVLYGPLSNKELKSIVAEIELARRKRQEKLNKEGDRQFDLIHQKHLKDVADQISSIIEHLTPAQRTASLNYAKYAPKPAPLIVSQYAS